MVRANTNVAHKDRRQLRLGGFLGADYSSSPFQVSTARATKMKNLINEYGVNRKRRGWRQVKQLSGRIRGIFEHTYGGERELLVISGRDLYSFNFTENEELWGGQTSGTKIGSFSYWEDYPDTPIVSPKAFNHGDKIYFVGNGVYVYGSWDGGESYKLVQLGEGEAAGYIPTTTININHDGYSDSEENGVDVRAAFEDANRLTPLRKNELVGRIASLGVNNEYEYSATWTLDASATKGYGWEGYVDIVIERLIIEEPSGDSSGGVTTFAVIGEKPTTETVRVKYRIPPKNSNKPEGLYTYTLNENGETVYGDYAGSLRDNKLQLDINTTPPVGGSSNIVIAFADLSEKYSFDTTGIFRDAQCGVMFGADGNSDRLFLAGGNGYNNVEIFSEPDDFTYFPFRNTLTVGSTASRIIGYQRLGDGTLAIFKEKSGSDASVFFRSGSTVTEYEGGTVSDMYAAFKTTAAGIGEALVSPYALGTLGGDVLMLSENGVYGIVLGTNAATNERYTRERSRSINAALTKHNLKNAVSVVYKDKYYLAVDGVCYVADARFTYAAENALDGAYNYEWWVWDNIPARCFAVINDKLYFGTEDGRLCVFDEEYADRQYYETKEGELCFSATKDTVTVSEEIDIKKYNYLTPEEDFYSVYLTNCESYEGKIIIPGSKQYLDDKESEYTPNTYVREGLELLAVSAETLEAGIGSGTACVISRIYRGGASGTDGDGREWIADCFELTEEGDEKPAYVTSYGFSLHRNLKGVRLSIVLVGDRKIMLTEKEGGEALCFTSSVKGENGEPLWGQILPEDVNLIARLESYSPVVSEWYSPIMDLGTNVYSKSLTRLTVSTEPTVNGNITVGYETRAVSRELGAKGLDIFDFNSLTFESFAFDTGFASSYTTRLRERNFNYIIFRFISETPTDCAVNDMTIEYKINKLNTGVK